MSSGIWVWIEQRDGKISPVSREAVAAARTVAGSLGEPVTALLFGHQVADAAAAAFNHGVDAVIGCDHESLADFRVEAYGPLLAREAQARQPRVILAGASTRGRDILNWAAVDLDAGVISDGIGLSVDGQTVRVTRPVYAGKLLSDVHVTEGVQLITLRSRAFAAAEPTGATGQAEWVEPAVAEDAIATKVVGFESSEGKVNLTDAKIIASGGRGVGGPEGFAPIAELADVLGGAMGASRATVDAGWIPYEHQVGQTGKTVSPDLYIACGISGAIQHQAGMRSAKVIVAINKDAEAPIFKLARYGIVGDLFKVVPALTAEFRRRLGK
jgi:electron transfer flavoprotein alpha subunit